ncbi:MAG: hypothetical protein KME45_32015, partial [Stenomitos rutilans HA7619-LM2]|nr:hypothetical protein [Stenomitos rutilans HA7619-LM2]
YCESLILRWVARQQEADAAVKARSPFSISLLPPFVRHSQLAHPYSVLLMYYCEERDSDNVR